MRVLAIIALCIALLIGSGLAWCKFAYPSYTYRYRMTVEVDVGGVVHTGSNVIEVTAQKQPAFVWGVTPVLSTVKGDAVFVDLGEGRNVIALLASGPNGNDVDYPGRLINLVYGLSYEDRDLPKFPVLKGSRDLPPQLLPTFVTFADLNDPKTARVVSPDEFNRVFGIDVHLKRAWIEMTTDPVTKGIEKKMPMLNSHRDTMQRAYSEPMKFTAQYHKFLRN
jgi:hypothetical protein